MHWFQTLELAKVWDENKDGGIQIRCFCLWIPNQNQLCYLIYTKEVGTFIVEQLKIDYGVGEARELNPYHSCSNFHAILIHMIRLVDNIILQSKR